MGLCLDLIAVYLLILPLGGKKLFIYKKNLLSVFFSVKKFFKSCEDSCNFLFLSCRTHGNVIKIAKFFFFSLFVYNSSNIESR